MVPTTQVTIPLLSTVQEQAAFSGPSDIPGDPEQLTVYRIRGDILCSAPIAPSPDPERVLIAMGIIVTDSAATGAFVAKDPSAPDQAIQPWLWLHNDFMVSQGVGFGNIFTERCMLRIPVDIKVRRRLKNDQRLTLNVVTNYVNLAANAVPWALRPALRVLYGRSAP
jgi:hypothetical protein